MKYYTPPFIKYCALLSVLFLLGCTKDFKEINTDPTRMTSLTPDDVKGLFANATYQSLFEWQKSDSHWAGNYAQYQAGTQTAFNTHRYVQHQGRLQISWIRAYVSTLPSLVSIINETQSPETVNLNAIARIWKVFTLHRVTDFWGAIPYSKIGIDSTDVPYDHQRDIYMDFFKELKESIADLENNIDRPSYGSNDWIYEGDNRKWLRFANSLRLRLAMRISSVEPQMAKEEAEAAIAGGVMADLGDNAYHRVTQIRFNDFNRSSGWNEFRLSASMESLFKGYDDPRMSKYFQPAEATGLFTGLRQGMLPSEQTLPENDYKMASAPSEKMLPVNMGSNPILIMYAAESYFLRAEGKLKGWNMGEESAEAYYNKGIELSMRSWDIEDSSVINEYINGEGLPIAPGGYFNTPALTDIPVKFLSDPAKQLEQIITQKWLAMYPDGHEAWAELRRTGYPRLYPLIHSENPDVPANRIIRRAVFLDYEKDRNPASVKEAEALLDGPDKASTPLWWDTNGDMFLTGGDF